MLAIECGHIINFSESSEYACCHLGRPILISLLMVALTLISTSISAQSVRVGKRNSFKSEWLKYNDSKSHKNVLQSLKANTPLVHWKSFKNWNECVAVVAESDSIVWVGTPVGLIRWNVFNKTFKTFDESNGLDFTHINDLAIDQSNRIWIATSQGLALYDQGGFSFLDHTNSNLPDAPILKIVFDGTGRAAVTCGWFLRNKRWEQGAVCILNGPSWQIFTIPNIYSSFGPPEAIASFHDTLWISWHTLYTVANNQIVPFPGWTEYGLASFAVQNQSTLWAETGRRTMKYFNGVWSVVIDRDKESIGSLWYDIWNDPRGGLWLSYRDFFWAGYGPFRLDFQQRQLGQSGISPVSDIPGQFYAHASRGPTNQFFASAGIGISNHNKVDIQQGGLFRFDGSRWEVYRIPSPLLGNHVQGLGCDPSGSMYVSTASFTQRTDGEAWYTFGDTYTGMRAWNTEFRFGPNGLVYTNHSQLYPNKDSYSGFVTGLDFDGYGNLWTTYPLIRYSWPGMQPTIFTDSIMGIRIASGYSRPQFMDVVCDRNNSIWAAAWYYGAVMFDQSTWHLFPRSDTTLVNYDYDLVFADSKGRVWFATNQSLPNYGLSMYDGNRWYLLASENSFFLPTSVYQFAEDHHGNVWMAMDRGLYMFDGVSFSVWDASNSPLKSSVRTVAVDLRGNVWVGTESGLFVFNQLGSPNLQQVSYVLPVVSLSVSKVGTSAKLTFVPPVGSTGPITYQLQRARGTHQFWNLSEVHFASSVPPTVELTDSTSPIGRYAYRIREVAPQGAVRNSYEIVYDGGKPSVSLSSVTSVLSGSSILLRWSTTQERFVQRFEVWSVDSLGKGEAIKKSTLANNEQGSGGSYSVQVDELTSSLSQRSYALIVVFKDSTRLEIARIDVAAQLPTTFRVTSVFPNPFNSTTSLGVELPNSTIVNLKIYDVLGRELPMGIQREFSTGFHTIPITMSGYASGVYFFRVEANGTSQAGRFMFLK